MSNKARKREIRKLKRAGIPVEPKVMRRRKSVPLYDPLSAALLMMTLHPRPHASGRGEHNERELKCGEKA